MRRLLEKGLVDELVLYQAPKLMGMRARSCSICRG